MTYARALIVALCAGATACSHDSAIDAPADAGRAPLELRMASTVMADVVFVIDNEDPGALFRASESAAPLLAAFKDRAERAASTSLHLGVLTSDFGAGATGAPGCTPSGEQGGGDQGKLQALGRRADGTCRAPQGASYLALEIHADGTETTNVPGPQSSLQTLDCMTALGASGCGFRHLLESLHAGLSGTVADNAGFLRSDAALAVVFVTQTDDCSAPPDSPLFDKNRVSEFGLETGFRCRRFGLVCGDPPVPLAYDSSHGPLTGCRPAEDSHGLLYEVSRYTDWLTRPASQGGLKDDPSDVVLYAIAPSLTPFEVLLSNPGAPTGFPYVPCAHLNEQSYPPCVPVTNYSCASGIFFGTPPVRLASVVSAAKLHGFHSWCDGSPFGDALGEVAGLLLSRFSEGCLASEYVDRARGAPDADCTVIDVTAGVATEVVRCDRGGSPCWRLADDALCGAPPATRLLVDGRQAPSDFTRVTCR